MKVGRDGPRVLVLQDMRDTRAGLDPVFFLAGNPIHYVPHPGLCSLCIPCLCISEIVE